MERALDHLPNFARQLFTASFPIDPFRMLEDGAKWSVYAGARAALEVVLTQYKKAPTLR
jgi:hypothetical protein